MTNNQHGQVPEALIDLIDAYAETRHRCGGIYNARTEVARKAVIEALSGMQALSAAPAIGDDLRDRLLAISKAIADQDDRTAQAMLREILAAPQPSPTAQADSQPGDKDLVAVPRDLIGAACSAIDKKRDGARTLAELRRYTVGDLSAAITSAPQADSQPAPAGGMVTDDMVLAALQVQYPAATVGNSGFDYQTAADVLNGKTVSDETMRKFVAASRWAHDEKVSLSAMLISVRGELASHKAEIALLKKALLEAEASPTPPVEQQAQPGAVYAELPAPTASIGIDDAWHEPAMRDFADRTHALRMEQAVPKAAPGEPFDECFPGEPRVAVPQGLIGAACFAISNKRDGGKVLEQLRRYSVGDISQPLAPQQEAQEPALFVSPKQLAALTDPDDPEGEHGRYLPARKTSKGLFTQPLYTAPQPAPAPLSEMPYEKRKAIQEGEQIGASDAWFKARHEMLDTLDRRNVFRAGFDRGWNAAIAAQGGK